MHVYTLTPGFLRETVVDAFSSMIWTERYYGDSDFQIMLPASANNITLFSLGTFVELEGSREIMMVETQSVSKDGTLTVSGISLLKWMNNRFVRRSSEQEDRYWNLSGFTAGQTLWQIVYEMLVNSGPTGVLFPEAYLIPDIIVVSQDVSGPAISVAVPYGPLYDALLEIATTYETGMKLLLNNASENGYNLGFVSYKGQDRTGNQSANPVVRFSPKMESLTNIEELRSIEKYKTHAFVFAPSNPGGLALEPGFDVINFVIQTVFDIRMTMVFAEDITTDQVGADSQVMLNIMNQRATKALVENPYISVVDGEVLSTGQFRYGQEYGLGDLVELEGYSGVIQQARVTEYIRSHNESGQKEYPTLTAI